MAKTSSDATQYVLLPSRGLQATGELKAAFLTLADAPARSARAFGVSAGLPRPSVRVIDSINEDKAKLVELSPEDAVKLKGQLPGARLVPLRFYRTARVTPPRVLKAAKKSAGTAATKIQITIKSQKNGNPVAGAHVVAFTDFANGIGTEGTTSKKGIVGLRLGGASAKVQRLYVFPQLGFWGLLKKNVTLKSGQALAVQPITFPFTDCLAHFYGAGAAGDGQGVTVGVIDTGSGPHADLEIAGGENTVVGEAPSDFFDSGDMHGTHVAGIIAARGRQPTGRTGVAPGATVMSYRVFGKGKDTASNYSIAKAIDRAVQAGCDLINMSLGGGDPDEAITSAIADARAAGVAVIVAAGNDERNPVSFPASDARAVAVSAMGRKGTFPTASTEQGDVAKPFGSDSKNFLAAFSNVGPEIDVAGTGVGVVSTVPGGYAVMSGTSMACPAVTGLAARLLSQQPQVLNLPRDQHRSDAIIQALFAAAKKLGFGPAFEGHGLPR